MTRAAFSFVLALLQAASSAAGDKVDLTPYLGIVPQVGDFRTYARPGPVTETVVAVEPWKNGWSIEYEIDVGTPSTYRVHESVVPGRTLWIDRLHHQLALPRPRAWAPLAASLPRALPSLTARLELLPSGRTLARLRYRATLVGFETVDTPAGTHATALRVEEEDTWLKGTLYPERTAKRRVAWYAAGLGRVASAPAETGVPDEWLVAAHIDDVTFP